MNPAAKWWFVAKFLRIQLRIQGTLTPGPLPRLEELAAVRGWDEGFDKEMMRALS
jgi:hypothetical protein